MGEAEKARKFEAVMSEVEKVLGIQEKPLLNLSIAELRSKLDTLVNGCHL